MQFLTTYSPVGLVPGGDALESPEEVGGLSDGLGRLEVPTGGDDGLRVRPGWGLERGQAVKHQLFLEPV